MAVCWKTLCVEEEFDFILELMITLSKGNTKITPFFYLEKKTKNKKCISSYKRIEWKEEEHYDLHLCVLYALMVNDFLGIRFPDIFL